MRKIEKLVRVSRDRSVCCGKSEYFFRFGKNEGKILLDNAIFPEEKRGF